VLTRRENVYVSLEERARVANRLHDAIFISVHFNSDPGGTSSGIETYYAKEKAPPETEWSWIGLFSHGDPVENDTSEKLAASVQLAVTNRTEARNRFIRSSNYYVVHHTRCPAVLVEGGFLSNVFESQLLQGEEYRERLAQGIVEGLLEYLKSRPPRPATPPRPPELARKSG
jgi:N-acetylmuramoyl-L-alanine amidase